MANKKGETLGVIPDFVWMQNADEVQIVFKITNPEHILVEIDNDKFYLKCVGGNKEKQLYEVTFYPLFKNIDKNKSGYEIILNSSVIVILSKVEKLMWYTLTKGDYIPCIENVKLFLELNNLELQLKEKNKKLKQFTKELKEKNEIIKALEERISDKDKKLQVIELMLKNLFDTNSKEQDDTGTKLKKLDNKSEELNFRVKDKQNEKKMNLNQNVDHETDEKGPFYKTHKEIKLMEEKKQNENKMNQKLNEDILSEKKDTDLTNMNIETGGEENELGENKEKIDSKEIGDISIEKQKKKSSNSGVKEQKGETGTEGEEQHESKDKIDSKQIGDISIENQKKKPSNRNTEEQRTGVEEKEQEKNKHKVVSKQMGNISIENQNKKISKEQKELNEGSMEEVDNEKSQTSSTIPLVTISGETKRFIHADTSAVFKIVVNDSSIKIEDVEAEVETPSGVKIPAYVFLGVAKRMYNINITPKQVGMHEIKVFVKKEFALSFTVDVYDTKRIKIDNRRYGTVARPVTFNVDVSKAGKGELSISIFHEDLLIKNKVEKLNDATFVITFLPVLWGDYEVSVFYNDRMVKNALKYTFVIAVFPPTLPISVDFPKGQNIQINTRYEFLISRGFFNTSNFKLTVVVEGPSGNRIVCPLYVLDVFLIRGAFLVSEYGIYKINVKLNDEDLQNSPHYVRVSYDNYEDLPDNLILYVSKSFHVLDEESKITGYLKEVPVNEKRSIYIDFSGVKYNGICKLDILIIDPENKEVPVFITGQECNFLVDFILKIRGDHTLKVIFNDEIVSGTPLIMKAIEDYDLLD